MTSIKPTTSTVRSFLTNATDFETAESTNKVAIIYGHNMYDYSMFSNLNKFLVQPQLRPPSGDHDNGNTV